MNNKTNQHPIIKRHLLFMWLYIFTIYIPFYIVMLIRHDVSVLSLSVIGWFTGGLHYIGWFLVLTFPFGLYQLFFLNRHFAGNYRWIYIGSVVSAIFVAIGSFIPLRWEEQYELINQAHVIVSVGFSITFMLIILITLVLYAWKSRHKVLLLSLCSAFAGLLLIGFLVLWTSALYQFSAVLSFMFVLLVVNSVSARRFKRE